MDSRLELLGVYNDKGARLLKRHSLIDLHCNDIQAVDVYSVQLAAPRWGGAWHEYLLHVHGRVATGQSGVPLPARHTYMHRFLM